MQLDLTLVLVVSGTLILTAVWVSWYFWRLPHLKYSLSPDYEDSENEVMEVACFPVIRLSTKVTERLQNKADMAGVSLQDYCRAVLNHNSCLTHDISSLRKIVRMEHRDGRAEQHIRLRI